MRRRTIIAAGLLPWALTAWASNEGMPNMPRIQPKKTYVVPSREAGEALLEQRGFGDQEPTVRMMNLMMVGGSGYEGMEMGAAPPAQPVPQPAEGQTATYDVTARIVPEPPRVGVNTLEITLRPKNATPVPKGLKIRARVSMSSMDMGTDEPKVHELAPGRFSVKVTFSMQGPWAVKLLLPEGGEKTFSFEAGP